MIPYRTSAPTAVDFQRRSRLLSLDQVDDFLTHLDRAMDEADRILADGIAPDHLLAAIRVMTIDMRRRVVAMGGMVERARGL